VIGGVGAYGRKCQVGNAGTQAASTAMNLESVVVTDGSTTVLGLGS